MTHADATRQVSLWGDEHVVYGEVAVRSLDQEVAVAISKGRYPKGYSTLDPNEDAVLAASAGGSTLLAVADGHRGFDAARAALRSIRDGASKLLVASGDAHMRLAAALREARKAVGEELEDAVPERRGSRTTLSVAIDDGEGTLTVGGFGDSDVKLVRPGRSLTVWEPAPFLGPVTPLDQAWLTAVPVADGDWIVVATDGVFDFLGRDWADTLEALTTRTASEFAPAVIEASFAGGAGDHAAVALSRSMARSSG